jgi:hypothetical protein
MVTRHGIDRATLVERVAADLDADLLDLRPFLADGVAGLNRWLNQLTFALQLAGGGEEDLPDLWAELGVDMSDVYRVLLGVRPPARKGN